MDLESWTAFYDSKLGAGVALTLLGFLVYDTLNFGLSTFSESFYQKKDAEKALLYIYHHYHLLY